MNRGTPPSAPPRHKTFGITDSLVDAVKNMYRKVDTRSDKFHGVSKSEVAEEPEVENKNPQQLNEVAGGKYDRPALKTRDRNIARKSSKLRSKASVSSDTTARFKQRHAGVTVATRKGTEGQPRATGTTPARGGSKRPVGGMGAVHHDLSTQPEADFRRKWGKSKSAMRTGLRNSVEFDGEDNLNEMHITVQANPGGTSYKVLSVSADIGSRVKVGENLSDTNIDDLRDSDVSISYKKEGAREAIEHKCANHVKSEQWGDGQCVPGMHTLEETSEGEGVVTHYDVMFEHGIEENIAVEDLEIISEKYHSHGKKKMAEGDAPPWVKNGDNGNGNGNGKPKKKSKKLDKVDPDELEGSHDERDDKDIDNDGDTDDSDKFLHKKRKAIKKSMKKDNGNGDEDVKEVVEYTPYAYEYNRKAWEASLAEVMHGNGNGDENGDEDDDDPDDDKPKKKKKKKGDKDENENGNGNGNGNDDDVEEALTKFGKGMDKQLADKDKAQMKAQGTIKMRKSDSDGIHGTTVNQSDTAKVAALKAKGYVKVSENTTSTKKSMFKEWVAMGNRRPGTEQVKDAMEAYQLAQHYLQIGKRDEMFGRKDKTNMKLAKQFYEQYKELKSKGDETSDDLFKNELADKAIESFSETETSQTSESWYEPTQQSSGRHVKKPATSNKVSKITKVTPNPQMTSVGSKHKIAPQYNTDTHKLVKKKGKPGLRTVPKDTKLGQDEYEAEEVQFETLQQDKKKSDAPTYSDYTKNRMRKQLGKPPLKHPASHLSIRKSMKESSEELDRELHILKSEEHAPEVVEYTPHAYNYNRKSWEASLAEVNRYKGRSGHRVTKPEKEGPEHIVMQMRKVQSLGDAHQGVDFGDGTKKKVSKAVADKFLNKYNSARPDEKIKLQRSAGHSHGGLHHAASDKPIEHGPGQEKKPMFKPAARRREPLRGVVHPDDE